MNSMLSLAVGICGAVFIGYCIYFDNKRRSDPNFKKKLRERRKAAREAEANALRSQLPPLDDNEAIQKFFLREVQLGEELLGEGDIINGVQHLANAVRVCGQPQQLLNVLRSTMPPQVFGMLLQQLATCGKQQQQRPASRPKILAMAEEEVE